jgi:hypothetical protein
MFPGSPGAGGLEVTNGALLISLAALVSGVACADDVSSRWSLGMQLGQARGQASSEPVDSVASASDPSPMSYDMAATVGGSNRFGWRVFTGYRFTDYLAIHVGYTDLGQSQLRPTRNTVAYDLIPDFERVITQRIRGVDVGLQLKVPVSERVSVDVHGGKYFWRENTNISGLWSDAERAEVRKSHSDSNDFFGAGLEIAVIHDLSATLSWTHYEVGSDPVALWTVGALYRFGFY